MLSALKHDSPKTNSATTAKIAIWYTFGNVFAKGLAFITTPIFTRLLSKSEFGQFNNFVSWEAILFYVLTLDFTSSIARAKFDFEDRMSEYLSSVVLVSNIMTLIGLVIVEIYSSFFIRLFSMDIFYIRLMFVYILFYPAFSYLQAKHIIYRSYKFFVFFSIITALLRTFISVLLVMLMDDRLQARVVGYVIPVSLFNLVLWLHIVSKGRRIKFDCVKFGCLISIPLIPHALSGILLGSSDRIMITKYCGTEQTALYSLAYQISLLANLIWTAMNQAWAPWLYENIHAGRKESIKKNSKIYLGVFTVLIIGVLLVTPEIILIFGGPSYYNARFVMPPVILGCSFQFVYGMYVNLEIYNKKTITISIGTVSAAILNIVLNLLFIPIFGYIAAAYTTLIGYAALFLFHFIIVKVQFPELAHIYDTKFILFNIIILFGASFIALVLYQYFYFRAFILLLYIVVCITVCYKNINTIKALLGIN